MSLMRHRHLMTAIAWCLTVIFIVGGTSLARSLVLCVGADGHIDLEVALGLCCVDEATGRGEADGDSTPALSDPCGGCADIELDATPLTKEKQGLEPPRFSALVETTEVNSRGLSVVESGSREGLVPPDLEFIASVVLLT